jgi:hypothetical protein
MERTPVRLLLPVAVPHFAGRADLVSRQEHRGNLQPPVLVHLGPGDTLTLNLPADDDPNGPSSQFKATGGAASLDCWIASECLCR